jgi:hypothetical protein
MLSHPLLDKVEAALTEVRANSVISVHGEWSLRSRRSYAAGAQVGSGSGPYVDVVDHVWDGRLTGPAPFTGMAFLGTESMIYWAKAAHASQTLAVHVSLHGYAGYVADQMTFSVGLDDVLLPGVPVQASSGQPRACLVETNTIPTGRVTCLARSGAKAFFVLLLPTDAVKFGRNRLWRLRDSFATQLPEDVRELLTRRRAGVLSA